VSPRIRRLCRRTFTAQTKNRRGVIPTFP
jgi:hypothetical protein